jgi:hypothetical protein
LKIKDHLETAWELTLEFIAPLIVVTLVMFAVWFGTLGILAPVTLAGYTHSLLRMTREGRDPRVKDLFAHMNLFLPLFGFTLLVTVAVLTGFAFLVAPGIVVSFLVAFFCLFVLPLMTDRKMGMLSAIRQSAVMALRGSVAEHAAVVLITIGILALGSSVFIGSLFTQPLATVFCLCVYNQKAFSSPPG